jgi:acyl-CoA synthetase (AMP-forming)/AMP-acid ligase II
MKNFSQILQDSYHQVPEKPAVHLLHSRDADQRITYRELVQHSLRYSRLLEESDIHSGEVVILILKHGTDLVCSFFGAVIHGAIPSIMPFLTEKLIPEQYRASLSALFEITAPSAVITYSEFVDEVRAASDGSSVRRVIRVEEIPFEENAPHFQTGDTRLDAYAGLNASLDDIVLLQHSSGTTGLQKGVALSHRAVFNQLESYSNALHLEPTDVVASWLPLYHDMGLIAGFIMPILRRVPLVLMSPFDWVRAPYRLMQAISRYRGTLCWLPNFAYNFCAQKIRDRDLEGVDLSSLRAVINCSEPMYWNSHKMFIQRFEPYGLSPNTLATSYAMAENVFAVTQGGIDSAVTVDIIDRYMLRTQQTARPVQNRNTSRIDGESKENDAVRMLSAGKPIGGTNIRVLDPKGRNLPERVIGEIAIQSNCMLTGYYNRPDLTEGAFKDGWYLTGDLGYTADGELYITGRKKDLIIVGGKNIYPQDIENLASNIDGVHPGRVVAFGVFNDKTGTEEVVIVAEADMDNSEEASGEEKVSLATKDQIANEIRQKVTRGSDIAVRHVQIVERNWLVKTSSGKIARSANRDKYLALMEQASNPGQNQ